MVEKLSLETSTIGGRLVLASSQPVVLEPNSNATIQLLDITSPAALPVIIGQQSILIAPHAAQHSPNKRLRLPLRSRRAQAEPSTVPPQALTFPIFFQVWFDPARIQQDRVYALSANVVSSMRRLEFITAARVPVLTKGAPSNNVVVTIRSV